MARFTSHQWVGRWMENFVLPCMIIGGMYIYVLYFHYPGVHGIFYGLDIKKDLVI